MSEPITKITTVLGTPPKKDRPRFRRFGGTYNTEGTKESERRVKEAWIHDNGEEPVSGAVMVYVTACYEPPKSWSKKKRAEALANKYKLTKPDVDNVLKSVLDGLNGIAYIDDNQVVLASVCKEYAETSFTVITVTEITKGEA